MKRTLTFFSLGLAACLNVLAGHSVQASDGGQSSNLVQWATATGQSSATQVQAFTLANGMTLLVQPDRRAPTAVHMVWVRVGAIDEVDGTSGVAHVLEHMMFKGSEKIAPGDFSRRVAALGGQENAFTGRDYTGYYQQVPVERLHDVMELEADRFANNQWPDEEFIKEMAVVKEERRMRTEDNPRAMLMEQLFATMFTANPYRRPIIGWMNDLDVMTPSDVRAFHQQWYVPGNAVIVVAGDVDPVQVKSWADATYGQIPARAIPVRKPRQEPAQLGLRRIVVKQPAQQAVVALAWHIPAIRDIQTLGATDKDALALLMLSEVLDGYDGARLERALVQGTGQGKANTRVADAASSSASVLARGPGVFMLSGIAAQGKTTAQLETALRAQIARIASDGVKQSELERVKTQWLASNVYARDSIMGQAQSLGSYWIMDMPVNAEALLLQHLQAITPADVQAVAAKYFGDDTLTIATLAPQPRADGRPARPVVPAADQRLH